jgi:pimeloyl-ACP methyl ester carboxylesterase
VRNLRTHGHPPFGVAVVHGGPGAPGSMAPVARELASTVGVLEPLQTASSLDGQVAELKAVLEDNASLPAVLIGWSWGAFLAFITAARYPALASRLILVGSAPFEEAYAAPIMETRLSRLDEDGRRRADALLQSLQDPAATDKSALLAQLGTLFATADSYAPLNLAREEGAVQYDVFQGVWGEAKELRSSGRLLALASEIRCPVVALHGDYDPHPAEGVRRPLEAVLKDFRFHLLARCGHEPWREEHARAAFYAHLRQELG